MLGKTIGGYKIEKFLGHGQFGEVYEASKNGEGFAIKFIRKDFLQKDLEQKVLEREISALKKVSSPYSVKYFEHGDHSENFINYTYIVMELVKGETIRIIFQNSPTPFDEKKAISIVSEILKGLKSIHQAGIIHRDLKPENIKITPDSKIKILDYGLSKIIDYSSITQTGQPIGTFYYMSPEQAKGEKPLHNTSDFYSVGVMLYEALTSQILFYPSNSAEIIYKTINVKPPYPSSINPKISNSTENIILRLLEKEAYKRYKDADEIITELNKKPTKKKILSDSKVNFYPRFIQNDTEVANNYLASNKIDGADFPINLHSTYKKLAKILIANAGSMDFFADPSTNRLTYSSFRKTQGLKALSYAPTGYDPLDVESFSDLGFLKNFVEQVVELQVGNGCSVITAPFFYFDSTNDDWYGVNIKILRESISYVGSKYKQYPISASICTNAELLCRKKEREKIINDFGNCTFDFLQLYIDKICETTVDAQIYNYILTALSIKNFNKTKLIGCRLPPVALGLLTIGFHAITSGLGVLETFDKGVITKEEDMARMPTRFYFPDLLKNIPLTSKSKVQQDILAQEDFLKKSLPDFEFDLKCGCPGCGSNGFSENFQKPRLHFLYCRSTEIKEMNKISNKDRKDYFFERMKKAYAIQLKLIEAGIKLDSPQYLKTWKDILKQF